jgi:uncharacterized phage protein gp47/JayE
MPFARPSLGDLWTRIGAQWRANYPGADISSKKSPDRAVIATIARSTDEDLTFVEWLAKQLFPFSAATEYLERWAGFKGLKRGQAPQAAGQISFAGGTPGYTAAAGTVMQDPNGVRVSFAADCTIAEDGTATASAVAVNGGADGNIGPGVVMTFVGTPAGFPDTGLVVDNAGVGFSGGDGAESDAQLMLRTQRRFAQPSFGGNQHDWENAALAVPGVTRVYSLAATPTPGAVTLYPLFDALRANGIPVGTDAWFRPGTAPSSGSGGDGDQLTVLNTLIGAGSLTPRPVCASLFVKAFTPVALNFTIHGLAVANDAVKAAIATEIAKMLVAKPPETAAQGYTIYQEWVAAAVAQAAGVKNFDLPGLGDTAVAGGTLLVPGVITYT